MMKLTRKTIDMNAEVVVREVMTKDVITVHAADELRVVRSILEDNPIHHVVVLAEGIVVGIISKHDILKAYQENPWTQVAGLRARSFMTKNPLVVDPDDTIGLVADIILSNRFHSLPVVEDGVLCGIITNHDLIKYCFK